MAIKKIHDVFQNELSAKRALRELRILNHLRSALRIGLESKGGGWVVVVDCWQLLDGGSCWIVAVVWVTVVCMLVVWMLLDFIC